MIVKKVQTNKVARPKSKALHVRDLCDYIAGPSAGDADEKVEHQGATNMLNVDHAGQVDEMVDLAETTRRSPQPVQHWIISWRQGEQPTAVQADKVVRIFLDEMGLGEHQCIYALHRNTDNYHLHLAVNRVHPDTERVVTVNGGFDIEAAHRAIARIEHAQGWQREAHGRYQVLDGGEVQRALADPAVDRQPTTRARDLENQTGEKSAQRVAIERGAEALRRARDWGELHSLLAQQEMRFERKGSGAVLWVGDVAVKASTAGRDCSLSALQKRLGEFTPPREGVSTRPLAPEPIEPAAANWNTYAAERQASYANRTQQRVRLRQQQRNRRTDMLGRHREERREGLGGDWRGRGAALNGLRSMLAARQAREKAELNDGSKPSVPPGASETRERRHSKTGCASGESQRWRTSGDSGIGPQRESSVMAMIVLGRGTFGRSPPSCAAGKSFTDEPVTPGADQPSPIEDAKSGSTICGATASLPRSSSRPRSGERSRCSGPMSTNASVSISPPSTAFAS